MTRSIRTVGDATPPPLVLTGPDGKPVTVSLSSVTDTVGDLADSLGLPRRGDVIIDGHAVERRVPIARTEIAHGSRVGTRLPCRGGARPHPAARRAGQSAGRPPEPESAESPAIVVVTDAGPAAGGSVTLGTGRHVIGRASGAAVRLRDDLVELHHAVIDVDAAGVAALTQLAGRVPCRVSAPSGDAPATVTALATATANTPVEAATVVPDDGVAVIGASRLRIQRARDATAVAPASLSPRPADPWRRTLQRRPRVLPVWSPVPVTPPAAPGASTVSSGGLLAAVLSIIGGIAVAVVLRNPMFLVFSAVGFLVAVGNRLGGRVTDRRDRRQRARDARRERARFTDDLAEQRAARARFQRSVAPDLRATFDAVRQANAHLWSRRADHADAFVVTFGRGSVTWEPVLAPGELDPAAESAVRDVAELDDHSVVASIGPGESLAIVGADAAAVVRSLIVQLAAWTGPADWRLLVVADDVDDWSWCAWLPHAVSGLAIGESLIVGADDSDALADVLGRLADGDPRHVVVVTDRGDLLATRTGPLRRYLESASSVAVVAAVPDRGGVPSTCRSVLEIGSLWIARWCPDVSVATTSSTLHAAGVALPDADELARRLARLHDPEDPCDAASATPASVTLSSLHAACGLGTVDDPIAIAARWRPSTDSRRRTSASASASACDDDGRRTPGDAAGRPCAAIGLSADGVVEVDLVRDGPHALIAGTTGAGKSELLRTLVVTLAARCSPDDVTFLLIDYKGGSTFDACADLPHTVGVVTDLDDRLAERALVSLDAEVRRRERLLRGTGAEDLDAYRARGPDIALPRLVVVIDEFAALAAELPGFLTSLVGVAQRGRSLGIHLILATQRPAGVVNDEIRANTNLRIALRLQSRGDAADVVGDPEPAAFSRGTPGRAMLRLGPGESVVFQAAYGSGVHESRGVAGPRLLRRVVGAGLDRDGVADEAAAAGATDLVVLARSIRSAASLCEIVPPSRPWLPPLPAAIDASDLACGDESGGDPDAVGLLDDPAWQRRRTLRWARDEGNLVLLGALGSGTSTALKTLLVAARSDAHLYVVDGRGDGDLDALEQLSSCAGVIGIHDAERRNRLLGLLVDEIDRRHSDGAAVDRVPAIVLAIDGLPALHTALSGHADSEDHGRLARILSDGVALGVHVVATAQHPAAVPASMLASFGQRWIFHLDDPAEAAAVGLRAASNPPAIPGRIVVAASRLEGQVAVLPVPVVDGPHATPPPRLLTIGTLGDDIDAATLEPSFASDHATAMHLGVDHATLDVAALDVPDGEHAIILGPARSGRSTALCRAAVAWREAYPAGLVVVHCPRPGSLLLAWAASTAGAVVADDETDLAAAVGSAIRHGDGEGAARRRILVGVDDAERVEDRGGALARLVEARDPDVMVVAAGRPDTLRSMYGHWTAIVRRSHIGVVMTRGSESDGELLGEILPRRLALTPRVGLAWLLDSHGRRLVQIAGDRF